jgi:hypothetical protein
MGATVDSYTNADWAAQVLTDLGAPVTQNNVNNVLAWMAAENSPTTWTGSAGVNNPLNNGLGSGGGNGTGSYPDLATAAAYAAKGLNGGISGAAPIGAALKANAPFSVFQATVINSNWASSHYKGSGFAGESAPAGVSSVTASASASALKEAGKVAIADAGGVIGANPAPGPLGAVGGLVTGGTSVPNLPNPLSWTEELGKILGDLISATWWERVGLFAAGGVLVIVGLVVFISTTKTGQKVESDAAVAAVA